MGIRALQVRASRLRVLVVDDEQAVLGEPHWPTGGRDALHRPRVQALLSTLCMFRLLPYGFTNRDLRVLTRAGLAA